MINELKRFRLVYLGTPYSKFPGGIELAFEAASRLTGELMRRGIKIYSPIAHTHPIAKYGNIDPLDHDIWLPFDETLMNLSDAMCVAMLPSWRDSYGIMQEIKIFARAGKPIFFLDPIEDLLAHDQRKSAF